MKIRIVPYAKSSKGAKALANRLTEILGYKVWRGKPKEGFTNLSWGFKSNLSSHQLPEYWVNHPYNVKGATDKRLAFFNWFIEGVPCVPWTTDKTVAQEWVKKSKVLARTACQQAGSGIKVLEPGDEVPDAQLYTKYIPKKQEFRVHVFGGKTILVSEKRKKKGVDSDYVIRSNHKGWVFCYKDVNEPDGLRVLGVDAVRALGLDFGAVDIIYNEKQKKLYVLEVNSAPGLCTATLEAYSNAISTQ
jgi:hypothetical protein